jgi:AsmA-like C-terminal region/AsmA family
VSNAATIPADAAVPAPRSILRWPLTILAVLASIWLLGVFITFLIHHTRLQRKLTHRLESVFGRHVEVANYDFSLWSGPTLVAESVTFSEDPRFGHEYFLRAESVKVRLHWQSLFRGHMDLGTVTFERPSLNLVRNAEGDWNIGEWLPRITSDSSSVPPATALANAAPQPAQPYVRFDRILFEDGRVNFKRADEKIPFAFTDVAGSVEPDTPGRWRIDLEAVPTRAAVPLQQPGLVHVAAQVGGTSSRFRPVTLALSWQDGSVSDLLRLARGYDFGVRGDFALAVNARADADDWLLETRTSFRSLHRWDMTLRPDNPDFNVLAKFTVHPQATGFDVEHATIEAPHSSAQASAHISWTAAPAAGSAGSLNAALPEPTQIEITQSSIDFTDVLGWIRAFHPEVAADASLKGFASATGTLATSPARVTAADLRIDSAEFSSPALRGPARLTPVEIHLDRGALTIPPATLSFGNAAGALHIDASAKSHDAAGYHVAGSLDQVRDLVATAAALGWQVSRGWDVAGPARFDLRWSESSWPWQAQPVGSIDLGGESPAGSATAADTDATPQRDTSLRAPFLNEPVRDIKAHVDLSHGERRVTLASAEAFGARWTGTLDRHDATPGWQFALSADHVVTADVDRWLNPRWRQSLLDRVFPFLGGNSASATPENLRASGRIVIDQLTVAPLVAHHVQGDLTLNGRSLEFSNASAQLASGSVTGLLRAAFNAVPVYHVTMNFSGVDLGDLSAAAPSLANQFDGSATGEITLSSHGATRSDLISALACEGRARIAGAQLRNINLDQSFRQLEIRPGPQTFRDAAAEFTCSDNSIDFRRLIFDSPTERLDATGSIDFSRTLDLTFTSPSAPAATFQLSGPLSSPSIKKITTP